MLAQLFVHVCRHFVGKAKLRHGRQFFSIELHTTQDLEARTNLMPGEKAVIEIGRKRAAAPDYDSVTKLATMYYPGQKKRPLRLCMKSEHCSYHAISA